MARMKQVFYRSPPFVFVVLLALALVGMELAEGPAQTATLHELASVDQLKARFNRDAGQPRLVLLLSPT